MSRVSDAWGLDPLMLWVLILEDEEHADAPELGEIAERLYVSAQQAWSDNARLRAEVHSLSGQLDHERARRWVPS